MLEDDLKRLGHDKVTIKADNEPVMRALQEEIQRRWDKFTLLENSPVGQSQSNGVAERAVQAVSEQIRVMRHALQNRIGVLLPGRHPVITWMVEHASELISAFQRGPDGKTPFERIRGKPCRRTLTEFADKVHYRTGKIDHIKKLEPRWSEGIFLGINWRTGEAYAGTKDGVMCSSATRSLTPDRKCSREYVLGVRGVPWHLDPDLAEHMQWEGLRLPSYQAADIAGIPTQIDPRTVRRMRLKRDTWLYDRMPGMQGIDSEDRRTTPQ